MNEVRMGLKQAIKNLDAFPRAEEHLLQKTQSGAAVSIVGLVIIASLFLHELRYYITTYTMVVDLKHGETLPIHINMTFPSLPCDGYVDAIDISGKHVVDLDTNIWKVRHLGVRAEYTQNLVEKKHFGDGDKDNHEDSDQKNHLHGFDQDAETMIKKVKQALANREGCRVYGVLDVQRVAGNFHISVHGLNILLHKWPLFFFSIFEGPIHVNVSHIIHDLSFGPKYPGIHNPLDETSRILRGSCGTFKYYIKIVPIEYRYLSKEVLPTNQFSVTEYYSPTNEYDRTWPDDLSPPSEPSRERRSFLHFITRLCAVLGGTFALTGMLDRWMYRLLDAVMKPNARSMSR
ncbi:Endoplasmic reticulum-Golgi intermediate compartment protein 3 [Camellia lanceoleosa]|uniref:Endoplasmic reticulum-Golgi intermediate compartment protein 3 n=1 Tax=Camellia lanceoleosa TaxID=1840588 RepID=A0ACC0I5R0_9ERIC|nr:Endoplasmic reticulum-Golgi intermediate compartment protein 3 [Camellia lanceoleosa]